jgi:hypothetical protein
MKKCKICETMFDPKHINHRKYNIKDETYWFCDDCTQKPWLIEKKLKEVKQ